MFIFLVAGTRVWRCFFVFQAEDGIRDADVTGVQTCALPIWPTDGTIDWLWPAAEKAQLPVALLAGDWLPLLGEIAARHPGLKLIVDHMGALRGAKGDAAFPNMKELTALAKLPNVAVKLTGGPFYADD